MNSSESRNLQQVLPQISGADQVRIAEIAATLNASVGHGCIYFGVCNSQLKIEAIEGEIKKHLSHRGIDAVPGTLAERLHDEDKQTVRVYVTDPVEYLTERSSPQRCVFFVRGLPELLQEQTRNEGVRVAAVAQRLNFRRELFRDRGICAFFWINPESVAYLSRYAPDFWSFRAGTAQFEDLRGGSISPTTGFQRQEEAPARGFRAGDLEENLKQLAIYRKKSPADENAIGNLLIEVGRLYFARHKVQKALDVLHEALAIFARLDLPRQIGLARTWLARAFVETGQLDKAEQSLREAIKTGGELKDERGLAVNYNNLSLIYQARGQLEAAERWLRMAIEIHERLGDEPALAVLYNNLSPIYKARGQLEEAERWLRKAIEIDERLGDEPALAVNYNNLSQIYKARGQLEEADRWLRRAIEIDERLGDEPNLAIRYNNLSQIHHARGQLEEAENWLRKALALVESKGPSNTLNKLRANLD